MSTNAYTMAPSVPQDMVFVFGSNEQGKHNGGAAKTANQQYGAEYHGQLVPTSGAAPVAPATTTNDPLSLTDGTLNGSL